MSRLVLVARLRPEGLEKAQKLLESGPPFDPSRVGMTRHFAFLSAGEVVFYFEGPEIEWTVDDLIQHPVVAAALEPWRALAAGPPRVAQELYAWEHEQVEAG
jgi:hypothetical protein